MKRTRDLSILFSLALTFAACGGTPDDSNVAQGASNEGYSAGSEPAKSEILDAKTDSDVVSRMCRDLGQPGDCDICQAAGWYDDGECDTFCSVPDGDCAGDDGNEATAAAVREILTKGYYQGSTSSGRACLVSVSCAPGTTGDCFQSEYASNLLFIRVGNQNDEYSDYFEINSTTNESSATATSSGLRVTAVHTNQMWRHESTLSIDHVDGNVTAVRVQNDVFEGEEHSTSGYKCSKLW